MKCSPVARATCTHGQPGGEQRRSDRLFAGRGILSFGREAWDVEGPRLGGPPPESGALADQSISPIDDRHVSEGDDGAGHRRPDTADAADPISNG